MGKYGQHNLSFRRRAVFFMCVRGSEKILVCEQVCKIPEIFKIEKRVENKKSNTFRKRCQYPSNTSTVGKKQLLQYPVLKSIFLSSLPLRAQMTPISSVPRHNRTDAHIHRDWQHAQGLHWFKCGEEKQIWFPSVTRKLSTIGTNLWRKNQFSSIKSHWSRQPTATENSLSDSGQHAICGDIETVNQYVMWEAQSFLLVKFAL